MIDPETIQNRQEKAPRGAEKVAEEIARMKVRLPKVEDELAELKRRIEACRNLHPPKGMFDGASWGHGRDAVIRALTAEE